MTTATEKPVRNYKLFDKIAKSIEENPSSYDQTRWGETGQCGTRFCIAGWAAFETGCLPRDKSPVSERFFWGTVVTADGEISGIIDHARDALGLTEDESLDLFDSDWTPPNGMSVSQALRSFGDGLPINSCDMASI